MFDFWRNLTRSAAARRQEQLNAYLDGALEGGERRRLESQLASDAELQAELNQLRLLKQGLRQLPVRRVPRNFTLDPALYGRPQPQPLFQAYPVLRAATVMTAFFFILTVAFSAVTGSGGFPAMGVAESVQAPVQEAAPAVAEDIAPEIALEAEPVEEEAQQIFQAPVAGTRVVELETEGEAVIAAEVVATAEMEAAAPPAPASEAVEDLAEEELTVIEQEEIGAAVPSESADDGGVDSARATVDEAVAEAVTAAEEAAEEVAEEPSFAVVAETPAAAATASAVPTATRSVTPREEPAATTVADRALVETAADEVDADAAAAGAEAPAAEPVPQSLETRSQPGRFPAGLAGLQIGLGVAFLVLAVLTLLARRRRT